jgi:hypothetical protein
MVQVSGAPTRPPLDGVHSYLLSQFEIWTTRAAWLQVQPFPGQLGPA